MMYEIGSCGLKPLLSTGKNDLEKGQLIEWRGNNQHKSVIYENMGIDEKWRAHGAKYMTINLDKHTKRMMEAYELVNLNDDLWHTQHHYILNEKYSIEKTDLIYKQATEMEDKEKNIKEKMRIEREKLIEKGKELFKKYIPANAKALIVAIKEIDDCELQTDYFNTKCGKQVILGYSLHKKNIFSEMRKHADKIEETKHLTEKNERYEHRENYSMGAGYYLKASGRYTTGWKIEKKVKWDKDWGDNSYAAIAENCIFE